MFIDVLKQLLKPKVDKDLYDTLNISYGTLLEESTKLYTKIK
jgi:hypothetical protein